MEPEIDVTCSLPPAPCSTPHAGDASPWRMNTPITSCPCSTSRWAATLESTPPLIASTTRDILRVYDSLAQRARYGLAPLASAAYNSRSARRKRLSAHHQDRHQHGKRIR